MSPPPSQTHCDCQSRAGSSVPTLKCEVGEDLAEQPWKSVPHSLGPPPDFAWSQSRGKSHNRYCARLHRETARVPHSKLPIELLLENHTPNKES